MLDTYDRWKVYFMRFVCILTGRMFYKFGITQNGDAVKRFSAENDGRWMMFRISCVGSFWVASKELALKFEKLLHSEYPKNIWLEKYLGHGNWNELHGITEIVALHHGTSEDDVPFRQGKVLLRSFAGAFAFFNELKSRAKYELDSPEPKDYTRVYQSNALTIEEVEDVNSR